MLESWPDESMFFGLAVQVSDSSTRQLHTASLYRFDNRLKIGDLQGHLRTRRAEARSSSSLYWVAPDLSQEDQRILAATIDAWLDKNANGIPYSVAHPGGMILKTMFGLATSRGRD